MLSKVVVFLIPNQSRYPLVCACYQVLRSTNVLRSTAMLDYGMRLLPSFTESPRLVTHSQLQEFGLSLRCNSGCCIAGRRWTCQTPDCRRHRLDDDDDDDDYYHYMVLLLQHDPMGSTSSNQKHLCSYDSVMYCVRGMQLAICTFHVGERSIGVGAQLA